MIAEAVREPSAAPLERASIGSISYALGSLRPIGEIDFLKDDPGRLELYRLAGFDQYASSDLSMRELAFASAAETLARSAVDPSDVGICLYVAESHDRDEAVNSAEVNRLLEALGLTRALPISIAVANCANIMAALRIAAMLVASGEAKHVLIVSVDKASRRSSGRKMFQEISLKSDGSVSCLVSPPDRGEYGILYIGQHNDAGLVDADMTSPAGYAVPKFQGIRHAANCAKQALGLGSAEFGRILTNNYRVDVSRMFIELCGFSKERGWFENIPKFAHAVAGDILINLHDLDAVGALGSGERIFMMADSITTSAVLCVRRR